MWNILSLFKTNKKQDLILKSIKEIKEKTLVHKITRRNPNRIEFSLDTLQSSLDSALNTQNPRRYHLIDLYQQALRDNHLSSQIRTRRLKVLAEPFFLCKKNTDTIKDKEKTRLLETPWFREFCSIFIDTQFFGHSLVEFHNFKEKEFWNISLIPRRNVEPFKSEVFLDVQNQTKIPYKDKEGNFIFKNIIEIGKADNIGLLYDLIPETIYKRYARQDWSRHSEKFGMPIVHIQTNARSEEQLKAYQEMGSNLGNNGFIITNPEEKVTNIEATKTDAYKIYLEQINLCNAEISKGINGQTGTTDEKSFAGSAEVHENILDAYVKSDLISLEFFVNWELIPFLNQNGYGLETHKFRFSSLIENGTDKNETTENTQKKRIKTDKTPAVTKILRKNRSNNYQNYKNLETDNYPFANACCQK